MTKDELVQEILKIAKENGCYRQQILDHFYGIFSQQEIRAAIAEARRQGMYSVPDMNHLRLGTWYQYDGNI